MKWTRLVGSILCVAVTAGLSGCAYTRAAEAPLPANWQPTSSPAPRGVVVFLPGLGDDPDDFVDQGFVAVAHGYGYDTLALDAHFGYYRERTITTRLRNDVLAGLKDRYKEVWLVGISLGGLGSALYCAQWGDDVTGVVLLAPYLGDADVWQSIEAAGGLRAWRPNGPEEPADPDLDTFRQMWTWLKRASTGEASRLYVGIGADDRFVRATSLITDALPPSATEIQPGGHRWTTWTPIFESIAERAFGPTAIVQGGSAAAD